MDLVVKNKKVYVISNIHSDVDGFLQLLKEIEFSSEDLMIVDGDIFGRGNKPAELYYEIIGHSNIQVIQGEHDIWLSRQILEKYAGEQGQKYIVFNCLEILEKTLCSGELLKLAKWIKEQPIYIGLNLNGTDYQIAHAQTYRTPECFWDKSKMYLGDEQYEYFIRGMEEDNEFISVVGHTATDERKIWTSPSGKTIRVDCGNKYKWEGRAGYLGAIRLNDLKEFYV